MADNHFPRRFQFSLRTLLLVVTLAGLVCAWAVPAVRAWQERQRFAKLKWFIENNPDELREGKY